MTALVIVLAVAAGVVFLYPPSRAAVMKWFRESFKSDTPKE